MRKETDRGRGIWQGVSKANKAKTIFYIECFHILYVVKIFSGYIFMWRCCVMCVIYDLLDFCFLFESCLISGF